MASFLVRQYWEHDICVKSISERRRDVLALCPLDHSTCQDENTFKYQLDLTFIECVLLFVFSTLATCNVYAVRLCDAYVLGFCLSFIGWTKRCQVDVNFTLCVQWGIATTDIFYNRGESLCYILGRLSRCGSLQGRRAPSIGVYHQDRAGWDII